MLKRYALGLLILGSTMIVLTACNDGVSQAELEQVRQQAEAARTMAAEARDIALRAEQKADEALAEAHSH
jgi:hypothetical protein